MVFCSVRVFKVNDRKEVTAGLFVLLGIGLGRMVGRGVLEVWNLEILGSYYWDLRRNKFRFLLLVLIFF